MRHNFKTPRGLIVLAMSAVAAVGMAVCVTGQAAPASQHQPAVATSTGHTDQQAQPKTIESQIASAKERQATLQKQVATLEQQDAARRHKLQQLDAQIAALRKKLASTTAPAPAGSSGR